MSPRPRPEILSIAPYVGGEAHLPGINRVIKLSSNEGPFGAPPGARAAYAALAGELHLYPDSSAARLRDAIGRKFGLDPERIVCGAGSDDLIYLLTLAYSGPGTEIIMTAHGFSIYGIAAQYAGARTLKAPERNLTADVDAILAQVSPATRIVFLANPNNPTGSMLPSPEVARLHEGLPPEVLLVLDGAYAEYVEHPDYDPGIALVEATDNTVMTRTFSKVFGMGGMRLGWAYAPPPIVDVLHRVRAPFNVNAAAQAAGIAALAEPGWLEMSRAHNREWRRRLTEALTSMGIKVWPSEANFLLADFGSTDRANRADAALRSAGIIARRVAGYGLPQCLRISIGSAEACEAVAETLAAFTAQETAHA
ncbi:MAG TPA: histidinol-phosphate transaminase [Acetobacteraceae bacterium]|nr:histidinol-phosphate transaminase [Acetobacteraceae bacterium]